MRRAARLAQACFRHRISVALFVSGLRMGVCILGAVTGLCVSRPASAQLRGELTSLLNVVKSRSGVSAAYSDARLNQTLNTGDGIRTGSRSKAQVTFSDKSILRVNELSDVVVRPGYGQRDVNIDSGRVYGDLKGPGRFRGRYAVAAVRGTKLEMDVRKDVTIVRVFEGTVIVTGANVQVITGTISVGGLNSFISINLIGSDESWLGARVDLTDGSGSGQTRTVTAFDPATGTITFNAPLNVPTDATTHFVLITPNNAKFVTVRAGFQTTVPNLVGGSPSDPVPTEPLAFAGGDEVGWMNDGFDGGNQITYRFGDIYRRFRQDNYELDTAFFATQQYGTNAPGITDVPSPSFSGPTGGINTGIGGTNNPGGSVGVGIGGTNNPGGTVGVGIGGPPPTGGVGVGVGNGGPTGGLIVGTRASGLFPQVPQIGGAGFASRTSSGIGYANTGAVLGPVFVRAGVRLGTLGDQHEFSVDELMMRYHHERYGDVQAGRFHWFPSPLSNSELGALVSFTTSDGILYQAPFKTDKVQLAWFNRLNTTVGPAVSGWAGRLTAPMRTGRVGASLLSTSQGSLGFSGDLGIPVVVNKLEFYGELGRDTSHQGFYGLGLYFPGILQRYHADLSLEYAYRGFYGSAVNLALHLPIGRHVTTLLTLSKPGAHSMEPGFGLQAHF